MEGISNPKVVEALNNLRRAVQESNQTPGQPSYRVQVKLKEIFVSTAEANEGDSCCEGGVWETNLETGELECKVELTP